MKADPAVANVVGYVGSGNGGFMYVALKPLEERKIGAAEIINRLRPKLNRLPVASAFLQAAQDLRIGGRGSNALYQYTMQADNVTDLFQWGPILLAQMKKLPGLQDVNTDQQNGGLSEYLTYDRTTAARLGVTPQSLDSALYSAFGQSEVSIIYTQLNQYYVVLEVAPQYWQSPDGIAEHLSADGQWADSAVGDDDSDVYDHAAGHKSHRALSIGDGFVQPGAGHVVEPGDEGSCGHAEPAGHAFDDPRIFCRHAAGVPGFAGLGKIPGHDGAAGGLHRAGDSVREPGASADDSVHAALGQRRRGAGADAVQEWTST